MQYTTLLLSALTFSASVAAQARRSTSDNSIRVVLENQRIELGSGTEFEEDKLAQTKKPVGSSGTFTTVTLNLGPDVQQQGLRCQILDHMNHPITLLRGENIDTTFADGGKGAWTLQDGEDNVSTIVCDPAFVQAKPAEDQKEEEPAEDQEEPAEDQDLSIRITLSDGNLATQTAFDLAGLKREVKKPVGSSGPFNSVALDVGEDVQKQDLRCQIWDKAGEVITLQRNENIDTTFGDGGQGPWTFLQRMDSEVISIACDPTFVKASA